MRNVFYLIAVIITWLSTSQAQTQTRPDGEREKLVGPVQSLRVERVEAPGQPRKTVAAYGYDSRGNLTESVVFGSDGTALSKSVSTYDVQGSKTEQSQYKSKDTLISKTIYSHNSAGLVIEADEYDEKNTLRLKTLFSYDEAGRFIEKRQIRNNELGSKIRYKYNSDGRLSEQVNSNKEGVVQFKAVHLYAPDLIRSEYLLYRNQQAPPVKTMRIRNLKKNSTEIGYYRSSGDTAWKWVFTYDDKDNVSGEEFTNVAAFDKCSYEYVYDSMGNWTKRTTSRWHQADGNLVPRPGETIYRRISYYQQPSSLVGRSIQYSEEQPVERVAGGSLPEMPIKRVAPKYSLLASGGNGATVVVEAIVDEEGNVGSAKAKSGPTALWGAAEEAVKSWKFKPALLSGIPAKIPRTITFNLRP
jgi:TonB family protein